ncbi:MAG: TfoX/Sxy family protein [Sulfuricaulis sp.]|uniref:TfoX/Sxy family protein n=1 Tax=Sulfuricaulis sp. TaxID=2003553 RepID=UPI003C506D65
MTRHSEFVEFVLELLAPIGAVRARAMFGGFGIYRGDSFFAIIVEDKLYFKTDHVTRGEFTVRGLSPFTYTARGKSISMQYYEAPPEVFEEAEAMQYWAQQAVGAAIRAKSGKKLPARPSKRRPK